MINLTQTDLLLILGSIDRNRAQLETTLATVERTKGYNEGEIEIMRRNRRELDELREKVFDTFKKEQIGQCW